MVVEVNWTDFALEDIANIADFISKDSYHYAQIQTERFFAKAEILEKFPLYGKVVPELSASEIRELVEGNYRIIYKVFSETRIDILTIHHSSKLIFNNPLFRRE